MDELENKIRELSCLYNFFDKEWIKSNIDYPVFMNKAKEIYETLERSFDFIMQAEAKTYDVLVEYENKSMVNGYLNIVKEILGLYDENKNMSLFNKIKLRSFIKSLEGMSCNKEKIKYENMNYDTFLNLSVILEYHVLVEKIRKKLQLVFSKDFFDIFKINTNQFGKYVNDIKSILKALLLFEKTTSEIDKLFAQMINTNLYPISYMQMTEDMVNSLFEDLKYFIVDNTSSNKGLEYQKGLREYYQSYNLQSLNSVILAISTDDLEEFQKSKNLLLNEINIVNQYNNIKTLYQDFVRDKKALITRYIYIMTSEEKRFLRANFEKACVYHYVEKFYLYLEEKQKVLPDLYNEREFLIEKEKRIIADLVSAKGWYHQNLRMSHNISQSLSRWLNLRKKVGKGNSKNNNLYLKEMRKEMSIAKEAIPVWIMPIDKVIEQYPFSNEPPFDVLIMDESSQSSIFAITALARAKKVIVVGDDKQISPMNIFTSVDETNDLRKKYLRENVWNYQIAKDTSIYDIVQTICGNKKVMLTEHFRCLPEIINYSNKEFYNMEINPLKVRDKTNTIENPIKTIYVPNAVCKKVGNQIINDAEIQRIITLIGEIEKDSSYKNKTIGVIVLQNSNKYIQKLMLQIMRIFGESFISERKIKIGTTYDFQGDERDVIILAMVISSVLENGDRYNFRALTAKEYDRSFNVAASRAKEQMILVHSVNIEELNPNCNRYKLLNYCLNYDKEKRKEYEKMFESNFEKDVYEYLIAKNYNLIPQFKVGNYRLDFVLSNNNEQKIAIECDGDRYHGLNELESDLKRQGILERCGWKFVRIRASEFYYDKEESMKGVISAIEKYLNNNDVVSYTMQN